MDKKELKKQYLQMKKDMGVFIVRCLAEPMCHIEATNDLKGTMNGTDFKLSCGSHPNRGLQKAMKTFGKDQFVIEILELQPYDEKDEAKTDYSLDLEVLSLIWKEKYEREGYGFYKR